MLLIVGALALVLVFAKKAQSPAVASAPHSVPHSVPQNVPQSGVTALPTPDNVIRGQARVVDGDTIQVGTVRIRLHGIDAPEAGQTCERGGVSYSCGAKSTQMLTSLISGRGLTCEPTARDRWDRVVARCVADSRDVGRWMVGNGWAVAFIRYSKDYSEDEERAKSEKLGLWNGKFSRPDEWRRSMESNNVRP